MTVERRVPITAGRVLDLLLIGRLTDELLDTLLALEVLFLMGVMMVLRCEVDEPDDERTPLRLATSTERLTGGEKLGLVVERVPVEGAEDFVAGAGLLIVGLGADLTAGADLLLLGGELGRGAETLGAGRGAGRGAGLGAGRLAVLEGAFGAGRETRAGADLAGGADRAFEAGALAGDRAGAALAERDEEDDLPLGAAALPGTGPRVIIATRSTANSVFSNCLVNIFLSPFPGRCSGSFKEPGASDPSRPN